MAYTSSPSDRASDQIYDELRLDSGNSANIRLLKLRFDNTSSSIKCEVISSSLNCKAHYTAVSYLWGGASAGDKGRAVPVRHNLWRLLHQLTEEHYEGFLWIDALCIQQTNIAERNHQVAIMGQIYASANEVLVWLTMEPRESRKECILSNVGLLKKQEPFLRLLSRNEYWTRAWILQECVLANRVTLKYGPSVVSEDALYDQLLFEDVTFSRCLEESAMLSIVRLRHRLKHGHRIMSTLFDILNDEHRPMLCSDPRDRIHSVFSLVSPEERDIYPIHPDYAKPATELLFEFTKR